SMASRSSSREMGCEEADAGGLEPRAMGVTMSWGWPTPWLAGPIAAAPCDPGAADGRDWRAILAERRTRREGCAGLPDSSRVSPERAQPTWPPSLRWVNLMLRAA